MRKRDPTHTHGPRARALRARYSIAVVDGFASNALTRISSAFIVALGVATLDFDGDRDDRGG